MRRRLKQFLPIVLMALLVQIFAPIGACWAASVVASDPLAAASICQPSANPANGQGDQTSHRAHDGCCSSCCLLQGAGPIDPPQIVPTAIERAASRIVWHDLAFELGRIKAASRAQARAPPVLS